MTRIFTEEGESIPVTVLDVSNNRVTQVLSLIHIFSSDVVSRRLAVQARPVAPYCKKKKGLCNGMITRVASLLATLCQELSNIANLTNLDWSCCTTTGHTVPTLSLIHIYARKEPVPGL